MKFFKNLTKVLLVILIINAVSGIGFIGYFSYSVLSPSLKSADVSLMDLIKSDLTPEQEAKLDSVLKEKATALGKVGAKKFTAIFFYLFPPVDFDYSPVDSASYPYPSASEIIDSNNENTKDALKQGLEILNQMDKDTEAIRKKAISDAQK